VYQIDGYANGTCYHKHGWAEGVKSYILLDGWAEGVIQDIILNGWDKGGI
jgi:hypothetical protein